MKTGILTSLLILILTLTVSAESIYELIQNGKREEAARRISEQSTAANRDGDLLFCQALLERDAEKAVRKLEAALQVSVSATYREEIAYILAQYYFMNNAFARLEELVTRYKAYWENGKYRAQMKRFSAYLDERNRKYEAAIKQIDRYLLEYNRGDANQQGRIDKARIMLAFNKDIAAYNLLRDLSREKQGEGVPQALYMLAHNSIKNKRTDDAVFFYNVLREGFPSAIGLDPTINKMENMVTSGDRDSRAEELTGTFYSVQVGVFSNQGNAKRHAESFKRYKYDIDIKRKTISNKEYHVVYVGRFSTYEEAYNIKRNFDASFNEVFQVVAR